MQDVSPSSQRAAGSTRRRLTLVSLPPVIHEAVCILLGEDDVSQQDVIAFCSTCRTLRTSITHSKLPQRVAVSHDLATDGCFGTPFWRSFILFLQSRPGIHTVVLHPGVGVKLEYLRSIVCLCPNLQEIIVNTKQPGLPHSEKHTTFSRDELHFDVILELATSMDAIQQEVRTLWRDIRHDVTKDLALEEYMFPRSHRQKLLAESPSLCSQRQDRNVAVDSDDDDYPEYSGVDGIPMRAEEAHGVSATATSVFSPSSSSYVEKESIRAHGGTKQQSEQSDDDHSYISTEESSSDSDESSDSSLSDVHHPEMADFVRFDTGIGLDFGPVPTTSSSAGPRPVDERARIPSNAPELFVPDLELVMGGEDDSHPNVLPLFRGDRLSRGSLFRMLNAALRRRPVLPSIVQCKSVLHQPSGSVTPHHVVNSNIFS